MKKKEGQNSRLFEDVDKKIVKTRDFTGILWNIAGWKKVRVVWDYLKNFDVIVLQETWLDEKQYEENFINALDNNFIWTTKAAVRVNKKGRAKGGQIIGIRKNLGKNIVFCDWKYGVIIEGDHIEAEDKKFKIITVYINKGMSNIKKHISVIIEVAIKESKGILMLGDLNARTGCENEANDDLYDLDRNYTKNRVSGDEVLNSEGRKLLNLCGEYGLKILNGCMKDDYEGKLTYIGEAGSSVLDYLIVKEDEGINPISSLGVESRVESDHLPVAFKIRLIGENGKRGKEKRKGKKLIGEKLWWDETKEDKYCEELKQMWESKREVTNIEERWGR